MCAASISTANSSQQRATLFFLYHELRDGDSRYTYSASSQLFRTHLDLFNAARKNTGLIWPAVTFDDGHVSNHILAAPLLESARISAHFFITAGWTGIKPGYMGWSELRDLSRAGHTIGAHGWTHKLLTHCNGQELQTELVRARTTLEDKLGIAITTMSLPGGRANSRVLAACAQAGYTQVFTSIPSAAPADCPAPGRLNVLGEMQAEWLARVLDPATGVLASLERKQRLKDAAKSLLGDRLYEKLWAIVNRHQPEDATA